MQEAKQAGIYRNDVVSMSQHTNFEEFLCSEYRCINPANEKSMEFELPVS